MKPGREVDEWGGSVWEEPTPEESKRDAGLEDLVKKVNVPEMYVQTRVARLFRSSPERLSLGYSVA